MAIPGAKVRGGKVDNSQMKFDVDTTKSPTTETLIPTEALKEATGKKAKSEKPLSQMLQKIPKDDITVYR